MLIVGWLGNLIALHLSANNSVEYVSYKLDYDIYSVHITLILLLPVNEFLSILVNFDVLYGINLYESLAANYDITFPNADNEVLMNLAYYNLISIELVFLTL